MTDRPPSFLRLVPRAHLRSEGELNGQAVFSATGDDPQLHWKPDAADRKRLAQAAAVRVRIRLHVIEGSLVDPCVYADWGAGFAENTRVRLRETEPGAYTALARSTFGALQALRIDPSSAPCRFGVSALEIEGEGEAARLPEVGGWRRLARAGVRRLPPSLQRAARVGRDLVGGDADARSSAGRRLRRLAGGALQRTDGPWREAWARSFDVARNLRSPHFAAPMLTPARRPADGPTLAAFYLPQFHPIPENDRWWGAGFTEWSNVTKAVPQFRGHHQPRLAADLGYYDLRVQDTLRAQAKLASDAGIGAFCFHYYWFGGARLLERPLDAFAADDAIDLPFALCWANENWTRRWDGQESEVLIAQQHSPEDDVAVFDDIARYMRSPRYLRVGGKPLLVVYRPDILPDAAATVGRWRARARATGLGELYLLCTNAFGFSDFERLGFDGLTDFPPHAIRTGEITDEVERLNPSYGGRVYDYGAVVQEAVEDLKAGRPFEKHPGVMPAWDNEARRPGAGHVFHHADPPTFHRWLAAAVEHVARAPSPEQRVVFINAWNEWAEGAYLEPDRWFGHGFLHAVRAAVESQAPSLTPDEPLIAAANTRFRKRSDVAVLLHVFYPQLIGWFAERLAGRDDVDLIISFPDLWSRAELDALAAAFPNARLLPVENRGRDLGGFVPALKAASEADYPFFLKLHSKRSPHMSDGEDWRNALVSSLAQPAAVERALTAFRGDARLGLLAPAEAKRTLGEPDVMHNNAEIVQRLAALLGLRYGPETAFPAGTMFWGRTEAFKPLLEVGLVRLAFEPELGRIDGATAHGLERLMAAIVERSGQRAEWRL